MRKFSDPGFAEKVLQIAAIAAEYGFTLRREHELGNFTLIDTKTGVPSYTKWALNLEPHSYKVHFARARNDFKS